MDILLNQTYEINNLVTQSGKFRVDEFQKAIINIDNNHKDYVHNNEKYMITTTKSVDIVNNEQILDVEILLPVSYRIPVEEPYQYKSTIKIANALYTKVEDMTKLQDTLNEVNQYIVVNKLQPITSAYLVQKKQENLPCIEIYIGLNPNIL